MSINRPSPLLALIGARSTEADVQARKPDSTKDDRPHVRHDVALVKVSDGDVLLDGHAASAMEPVALTVQEGERVIERARCHADAKGASG